MMNRRVIIILLSGLGFLCLCTVGFGALFFIFSSPSVPTDVAVIIDTPRAVPLNEPYAVQVHVQNLTAVPQTLDSIDIQNSYLEGVRFIRAEPSFTDSFEVPIVGYQSYTYQSTIAGNNTAVIDFVFEGEVEGTFTGDIDICINDASDCMTRPLIIEIGETTGR